MQRTGIIGRSEELRKCLTALSSPPAIIIVEGDAGVGKTCLVDELARLREATDELILTGGSHRAGEDSPFGPIVEALRDLPGGSLDSNGLNPIVGVLAGLLPEFKDLPPRPEAPTDARAHEHLLLRAIHELIRSLGKGVMILEDLHWADARTLDAIAYLLAHPVPGFSLILTFRRHDIDEHSDLLEVLSRIPTKWERCRIALGPLTEGQVAELVSRFLGSDKVSKAFARHIFEKTSGVPFAVEELLRLLLDRKDVFFRNGMWSRKRLEHIDIPSAVRDLVIARVDRMDKGARDLLRAASVFEGGFEPALVISMARDSSGDANLARAVRSGLIRETPSGTYDFNHALTRQAIYEDTVVTARAALHIEAAHLLEGQGAPHALIAHHYKAAGDIDRWVTYAEKAADVATTDLDYRTAYKFLGAVLECHSLPVDAASRIALKFGKVALGLMEHSRAISVLRNVMQQELVDDKTRAEIRMVLGSLIRQDGGAAAIQERLVVAEELGDPRLTVRALADLALPAVDNFHHAQEHVAWLERATIVAGENPSPDIGLLLTHRRASLLLTLGDAAGWDAVEAAYRLMDADADAVNATDISMACINIAQAAIYAGHYSLAQDLVERGNAVAEREKLTRFIAPLNCTEILLDWANGRWEGLEERARSVAAASSAIPHAAVEARLVEGLLLSARGLLEDAQQVLLETARLAERSASIFALTMARGAICSNALALGEDSVAIEEGMKGQTLVRNKGFWTWAAEIAPGLVEALVATGKTSEAQRIIDEVSEGDGSQTPAATSSLQVCRGIVFAALELHDDAATAFHAAAKSWGQLCNPYREAQAREREGLSWLMAGDEEGADLLRAALAAFENLTASRDAARVRRRLRDHGVRVPRPGRAGRRSYGDRLSPREEEVARLIASGHSNRDIAELLHISPRTVEQHVEHAKRKLNVSSRTALAVAVHDPSGH